MLWIKGLRKQGDDMVPLEARVGLQGTWQEQPLDSPLWAPTVCQGLARAT